MKMINTLKYALEEKLGQIWGYYINESSLLYYHTCLPSLVGLAKMLISLQISHIKQILYKKSFEIWYI